MSNSRLPPKFGETPTKVVLEGTDPGDPAARQLFVELQGQIARFHSKARQSREISEQDQLGMQQALPGGGRMRYQFNSGQETLFVRVNPQRAATTREETVERKLTTTPVLAIDVLFDPQQFEAGDIYSIEKELTTIPGTPGGNNLIYPGFEYTSTYPPSNYGYEADDRVETSVTVTVAAGGGNLNGYDYSSAAEANDAMHTAFAIMESQPQPQPISSTFTMRIVSYTQRTFFGARTTAYFETVSVTTKAEPVYGDALPTPPRTVEKNRYFREVRTYLNVLPVVGLRVDGPRPYEALSTVKASDARLQSLVEGERTAVSRAIAFDDPAGGRRFYGAGFAAAPRDPVMPGVPPEALEIEVWVGSANVSQSNEPPGTEGAQWGVDSPGMSYATQTASAFTIRAREFSDGGYQIVRVGTDAQGKIERFEEAEVEATLSVDMPMDARHIDWRFAAGAGWTDSGQEPAQPEVRTPAGAPTMGSLLAELDMAVVVAPARTPARSVPDAPVHEGGVTQLTKVAVIRWTPAEFVGGRGTAEITPA